MDKYGKDLQIPEILFIKIPKFLNDFVKSLFVLLVVSLG